MRKLISSILLLIAAVNGAYSIDVSTAGFYELRQSGREVYNVNPAWRFIKSDVQDAHKVNFDDSNWDIVSLPHGLELLPEDASGCANYQGVAWYRKNIKIDKKLIGNKLFLHFEGIMGRSKIWVNGELIKEHVDGYLPAIIDITDIANFSPKGNVVAVMTDNSDDPLILPGKPQRNLDFAYLGGIYRDCFLISHNKVHITDPNNENIVAGGGISSYFKDVTKKCAEMGVDVHIRNSSNKTAKGKLKIALKDNEGKVVANISKRYSLQAGKDATIKTLSNIKNPNLWNLNTPYLYDLEITICNSSGDVIDGFINKVGVKEVEFRGSEGLFINGEKHTDKLMGVNRHQDFAIIGNALPNSLHVRDVIKLREAGVQVIRLAHYPHDPAFLDACDRYGIFVMLPIAGWQFWNNDPIFEKRVYEHIRNLVRRDRNHASIFIWEPVLNETHYPESFAKQAKLSVDEEFIHSQSLTACDPASEGSEHYPVIFSHPKAAKVAHTAKYFDPKKIYYTREFGDNVDDWNSHNSTSRVHRSWGEVPMLVQSKHYASPDYTHTCLEMLYGTDQNHLGGTLWHAFDHQRGYHPQPFYGGIMDAFRQPKTSYYMFESQRPSDSLDILGIESGPMLYIANEMTPFSPEDVTIYSNCEEVRLTVHKDGKVHTYNRADNLMKMPSPIITFEDIYYFKDIKARYDKDAYLLAEGLIDGKVVVTQKRQAAKRPTKLQLRVDDNGIGLKADGSDIVVVIAEIMDNNGRVKRLNNSQVKFTIEGEGNLLGDHTIGANPVIVNWGSAPILVQATDKAGLIKIKAEIITEGIHVIAPATIEFSSTKTDDKLLYDDVLYNKGSRSIKTESENTVESKEMQDLKYELNALKKKIADSELKEVEKQQTEFGEKR